MDPEPAGNGGAGRLAVGIVGEFRYGGSLPPWLQWFFGQTIGIQQTREHGPSHLVFLADAQCAAKRTWPRAGRTFGLVENSGSKPGSFAGGDWRRPVALRDDAGAA